MEPKVALMTAPIPIEDCAEIEATDSDWDREKLEERLAKLAGGVAVIKVGAATETDLKKRKEAVEDAVAAAEVRYVGAYGVDFAGGVAA